MSLVSRHPSQKLPKTRWDYLRISISRGVMAYKLDLPTIVSKFNSHCLPYTSGHVPQLSIAKSAHPWKQTYSREKETLSHSAEIIRTEKTYFYPAACKENHVSV